ncbi:unnamed protein product [Porites lobata]|uniref:Iodothyronine deiodinase n=1 Tax=Porites lobata TaxID=104759 RepID=A0ABN8QB69_9CNID|nr:unnamed protein product [Porites lobata]
MADLQKFSRICRVFQQEVDFLLLYIEEAHPTDGWAFENNYNIPQHRTTQERCQAAKLLQAQCPAVEVQVAVDTMWNTANAVYGAIPERLYIIKDSTVLYQGGVGPFRYDLSEMQSCLSHMITGGDRH